MICCRAIPTCSVLQLPAHRPDDRPLQLNYTILAAFLRPNSPIDVALLLLKPRLLDLALPLTPPSLDVRRRHHAHIPKLSNSKRTNSKAGVQLCSVTWRGMSARVPVDKPQRRVSAEVLAAETSWVSACVRSFCNI